MWQGKVIVIFFQALLFNLDRFVVVANVRTYSAYISAARGFGFSLKDVLLIALWKVRSIFLNNTVIYCSTGKFAKLKMLASSQNWFK